MVIYSISSRCICVSVELNIYIIKIYRKDRRQKKSYKIQWTDKTAPRFSSFVLYSRLNIKTHTHTHLYMLTEMIDFHLMAFFSPPTTWPASFGGAQYHSRWLKSLFNQQNFCLFFSSFLRSIKIVKKLCVCQHLKVL
jgi:hypothetical protein